MKMEENAGRSKLEGGKGTRVVVAKISSVVAAMLLGEFEQHNLVTVYKEERLLIRYGQDLLVEFMILNLLGSYHKSCYLCFIHNSCPHRTRPLKISSRTMHVITSS